MKKTVSLLLAIVMVFSLLPISVFAAEAGGKITFTTDFTNDMGVDDTFTVTATLSENPGINAFANQLKWNEQVVEFLGFKTEYDEDEEDYITVTEVFSQSGWLVDTNINGSIAAARTNNKTKNGVLYVGEFKIIADEGSLELGLTTTEFGQKFTFASEDGTDIMPVLDFSAISGLTVGGKPVGPEMPEDAPFTAITTDAGPIVAIEQWDDLDVDPWGSGTGTPVVHYHITVSEDTTEAYVRFALSVDNFVSQNFMIGENEIGSAYASVNHDDLDADAESGMAGLQYGENGDDYTVMIIPMEFAAGDMMGNVGTLPAVKGEDELYYAVGPQDNGGNTYAVFSFEYAAEGSEEELTYKITVNQTTGGTVSVTDTEGNEISEAVEGATILLVPEPVDGYKFVKIQINGEDYNLGEKNGCYIMGAEDIVVSAVFEETHTCTYSEEVVADKYLKSEATCQSGAVYYKSCTCGKFATTAETFVSGETVTHHYVGGKCEWCQLAEVIGYRFATSADVSAENGGTAVVKVMITGHSDPNVTKYNAYDITLTYDSDKLEYQDYAGAVLSDNGRVEVDEENGTIRIVGCGADKDFGTEIAALTFKTKAEGEATVTIDKVQVSDKNESVKEDAPEATPKHEEEDPDADETPGVSVVVVPYSVTKPDFISGNVKILHGEDYTFSYSDITNYTYSDLTVKVGGVAVENLTADENGVYTIANVTGAIEITATQTPNSYDVTKPENVTGPDKATYGTDYVFTVTPSKEDMAIDTVIVKYADGSEVPYTVNENGEYVIAGTDITGAFTITVTEKEKMTTITFSGIEEDEIDGGKLTMAAEIGKDFTFKLIKKEGFDYTVKVGETELTESEEVAGQYTIPAEQVVKGGVTVTIEKVDNTTATVDVAEYINLDGKTMFLVTAKWGEKVLAYGEGNTMFWSDKYTVTGEEEAGAYCWLVVSTDEMNTVDLVKAAAEAAIVEAAKDATATTIKYNYDINGTTKVDVNDAQLAYDMYNASYMDFTENLPMLKFLEADVKTDSKLDTQDVAAIISFIVSGANA